MRRALPLVALTALLPLAACGEDAADEPVAATAADDAPTDEASPAAGIEVV